MRVDPTVMSSPSLLDALGSHFPLRQIARAGMALTGFALVAWAGFAIFEAGYWWDTALAAGLGVLLFYAALRMAIPPTEFGLAELLGSRPIAAPPAPTAADEAPSPVALDAFIPPPADMPPPGDELPTPPSPTPLIEAARPVPPTSTTAATASLIAGRIVGPTPVAAPSLVRTGDWLRLWPLLAPPLAAWTQTLWLRQLTAGRESPNAGSIAMMLASVLAFWPAAFGALAQPARADVELEPQTTTAFRPRRLLVGAAAMSLAYFGASGNRFTAWGVLAWAAGTAACLAAFWDGPAPRLDWPGWVSRFRSAPLTVRLGRTALLLGGVLIVAAVFRFAQLDAIPPEMTSDHVEKLMDVRDVLEGSRRIFFERNTGREPLQFYFAAWLATALGTGLTHLTLKITGAIAGLLTIPFIYLLGREWEDETLGLLAAMLAAFAFWPTATARIGLRFPLMPLFAAPVLFFLFRGLRTGRRADFLWAGLAMGAGLYGYSPFRVIALAALMLAAAYLARPQPAAERRRLLANLGAMAAAVLAVFVPLLRYANEHPDMFWYRALGRLSGDGLSLAQAWPVFWANQWNALRMFNWRGDSVWVNTLPGQPTLDPITGGLLILGAAVILYRAVRRRSLRDGLVLALLPVLMLPSSLSLAFPMENPSVVRASAAMAVVFPLAAQPLRLALRFARDRVGTRGVWAGGLFVGALLVAAAAQNYRMYFEEYPAQYVGSAQNASEVGAVVRDFAESIGSYDTVVVRAFPHWVDTRAVGFYAGKPGWDNVYLDDSRFAELRDDPRPRLYILHRDDRTAIAVLRAVYPQGTLSRYESARPHHDFLLFFVPGIADLDEASLPPVGSP